MKKYKLDYLFLTLVSLMHYGRLQWNGFVADPDAFYHAKMAELLSQGKLIKSLPWMQFSTIKENFTDHQLLYHLLLAPFNYFTEPLVAAKIATVLFSVANVLIFYCLLKKLKIKYPIVFSLLLLTSLGLNWRLMAIKANSLSLIMLWGLIYSFYKNKYKLSAILSAVFVWLYGAWPLSILILFIYKIAENTHQEISLGIDKNIIKKIFAPLQKNIILNKLFLFLVVGILLGLIINPYWPNNFYFFLELMQIGAVNYSHSFNVGSEWHSVSIQNLISSMTHIFALVFLLFILSLFNIKRLSKFSIFSLILSFVFLVLTIKSARYIEYFVPFAILFAARSFTDLHRLINLDRLKKIWQNFALPTKIFNTSLGIVLSAILVFSIYKQTIPIDMGGNYPLDNLAGASRWLESNSQAGDIVFNSDWDEWPQLFYFNDSNYYIIGLDFTLMYNYNQQIHRSYNDIMLGKTKNDLGKIIQNTFDAQYILVTKKEKHQSLLDNLQDNNNIKNVYEDSEAIVYKINL